MHQTQLWISCFFFSTVCSTAFPISRKRVLWKDIAAFFFIFTYLIEGLVEKINEKCTPLCDLRRTHPSTYLLNTHTHPHTHTHNHHPLHKVQDILCETAAVRNVVWHQRLTSMRFNEKQLSCIAYFLWIPSMPVAAKLNPAWEWWTLPPETRTVLYKAFIAPLHRLPAALTFYMEINLVPEIISLCLMLELEEWSLSVAKDDRNRPHCLFNGNKALCTYYF